MFNRRVLFLSVFSCAVFMLSGCSSNRFASRDANATYVNTQLKIIPRSRGENTSSITMLKELFATAKIKHG